MPPKIPPPTSQQIDDAVSQLQAVWRDTHTEWNKVDTYYHREFPVFPKHPKRPSYHSARPTSIIDHAADTQLAFMPKVRRQPLGEGDEAKKAADRVESAVKAILISCQLFDSTPTWKLGGRYLVHYGAFIPEGPMWEDMEDSKKPRKGKDEDADTFRDRERVYDLSQRGYNPFRIRAVHPSTVLLDPAEKIPSFSISRTQRKAQFIEELSASKSNRVVYNEFTVAGMKMKPLDIVNLIVYTDKRWITAKLADKGEVLYSEMNPWGFIPHALGFSGFGMQRMGGGALDENLGTGAGGVMDPKHLAIGLLNPVMDSIRAEAQHISARQNAVMQAAFAKLAVDSDAAGIRDQLAGDDDIVEVRPEDIAYLKYPDFPRWMDRNGQEIKEDITSGTYDPVLAGSRQEGINTLGQQLVQAGAAQRKFAAPAVSLNHLVTIMAQRILRMAWIRKRTIYVDGTELRPADIKGNFNVEATFELIDPVIQSQQKATGMQEVASELKSTERYLEEDAKVDNVSKELERIDDDRARKSPIVSNMLAAKAVRRAGFDEAADALESEAQAQLEEIEARLSGDEASRLPDVPTPATNGQRVREPLGPNAIRPNQSSELIGEQP